MCEKCEKVPKILISEVTTYHLSFKILQGYELFKLNSGFYIDTHKCLSSVQRASPTANNWSAFEDDDFVCS